MEYTYWIIPISLGITTFSMTYIIGSLLKDRASARRRKEQREQDEGRVRDRHGIEVCTVKLSAMDIYNNAQELAVKRSEIEEYDFAIRTISCTPNGELVGARVTFYRKSRVMKGKLELVKG